MFEPRIIGFLCTWCSYTGADLAGTARLNIPWNFRGIRVPCSGRVSPELVIRAFDEGADGVIVLGCHLGECHYDTGNHRAAKRFPVLQELMEFVGLEPERILLDWVSASEGIRFSNLVTDFTQKVRVLGPVKWKPEFGEFPLKSQFEMDIDTRIVKIGRDWADQDRINSIQIQLQDHARELLKSGIVDCVIGYENGTRGATRPAFIYKPEDSVRLVWNQSCTHNLTTYLQDKLTSNDGEDGGPRVAVVVKPCDSKTINVLTVENQIDRERVHVIGVICDGIRDQVSLDKPDGNYQSRCIRCTQRVPYVSDTLLGDPFEIKQEADPVDTEMIQIEAMAPADRMAYWLSQFDRCIRCYACRQVCPLCYCPTCLFERNDSLWVGMNIEMNQNRTFHLGRAFHLAGRCIGCDECQRVCPMDIPIGLLNRKLSGEIETLFGYRAGLEPTPSPIATELQGEGC